MNIDKSQRKSLFLREIDDDELLVIVRFFEEVDCVTEPFETVNFIVDQLSCFVETILQYMKILWFAFLYRSGMDYAFLEYRSGMVRKTGEH